MHDLLPDVCEHTPYYCEENVFLLAKHLIQEGRVDNDSHSLSVVIVSNPLRKTPMWHQKASDSMDGFIVWDYHVFLVARTSAGTWVLDRDSSLPFPSTFHSYVQQTFRPGICLNEKFHRIFRVIPAVDYISSFSSDRSHMLDASGQYQAPPPLYPPILQPSSSILLTDYLDMTGSKEKDGMGLLCSERSFYSQFQNFITHS
ncbi:MAG: protein N-terminal glutamine amidohydrolase [Piptocephalis tieghemiana]|nr:MAG: protein N-terminal glutamine amidohydrolase [Piptocephalis tieghemiana]